ncbi:MAG: hypothetical protein SOU95_03190 [Candidatus Cryptobacteroides sp.]|nr:hypothetical protein [Bacteroidales bacterium]MDY2773506.1 hypothetical protein [Candidatus Cryptobacteroides sp.]
MKNIIFAATAMVVAMTAVSCSKIAGIEENPLYTYRFAVVNEELPSVKSNMNDDHLVFETGDYLGFSLEKKGVIVQTQRTSIQTTDPRPIFGFTTSHQMTTGDRIYVVSPRVLPINNGNFNNDREPVNADPMQSITIPLVQTHKGGKFDGTAMPMVSVPFTFTKDMLVEQDNQLQEVKFLNLGALLEFRVFSTTYQGETVRDVIFEADKNIVGEFKINVQDVNPNVEETLAIDLTSPRAEGDFATPVTNVARTESDAVVGANKDDSRSVVRMVVAPGTYTGKVKVRTDKAYYVFKMSEARTFDRNGIYPLGLNLDNATRVVMEIADKTRWFHLVKFVNSYYQDANMRAEKMYDGDLTSEWVNPWNCPLVGAEEDDYNYQWSGLDYSILIGENKHRNMPNIVFVIDFQKDIEIGRIGIGKSPFDWPYNHDLRNCEFYVGTKWNFKSASEKGNLENYNTANDDNDWKLVLTATDIPKETGIFWYDVPETVSKADRTGRYLKIRPTAGYRGNTPCEIAEIYVDGIVQENTANVE